MKYKNKKKRLEKRIKDYEQTLKRLPAEAAKSYKKPSSLKH
jgi:hypothetical protein